MGLRSSGIAVPTSFNNVTSLKEMEVKSFHPDNTDYETVVKDLNSKVLSCISQMRKIKSNIDNYNSQINAQVSRMKSARGMFRPIIIAMAQQEINRLIPLINAEASNINSIQTELEKTQRDISYYSSLIGLRKQFNNNIENPIFEDFPTSDQLFELAKNKNVTNTIAFQIYTDNKLHLNVNMSYPNFVVDLAVFNCVKDRKVNFDTLSDNDKKLYLVTSTKYICDNIYGNDELLKLIEYRIDLFDKYYKTLKLVDENIARTKVDRIVKAVKEGQVVNEQVMGNKPYYFHGFITKDQIEDETMGFSISLPSISISLPKITLPEIKIPSINLSNAFSPMYIPVVTEFANMSSDIVSSVSKSTVEIAKGVVDAGGTFIQSTGQFIANSPNMVVDIVRFTGQATNDLIISPVENLVDGVAYAILPPDVAKKIDKISDIPSKTATGKLTVEDLREAGECALKLAIAPTAFVGKITADAIDSAKKNCSLIRDLDKYSGGLLSSASNVARASHDEYEGKGHDPALILDAIKIGLVVFTAGTISSVATNIAEQTATSAIIDKTGIGGETAQALVKAYQTGDVTAVASDYASNKAMVEGAKQVSKATGVPMEDVLAVGQGVQQGKPVSQALMDAGKSKAKNEINQEIKKKTGLPVTIDEITNSDPTNKKSLVQEIVSYAENPEKLKQLVVTETKLAMQKEREKAEKQIEQVKNLKENIENFNAEKETKILQANISKEIDKRVEDAKRLDKEIENYSSEDAWSDLEKQARIEKDKATKKLYEDMYGLKEKYFPQALLDYLMYTYGPKPDYDMYLNDGFDWGSFQLPDDGTQFKNDPNKGRLKGLAVVGTILGAYTVYKLS